MIRNEYQVMTPRQFAILLGVLVTLAGFFALILPISGGYDSGMFGDQSVDCGTALATHTDAYSGDPLEACQDAIGTRRAWSWPVAIVGVVVLAGAVLVRSPQPATRPQPGTGTSV